MFLFSGKIGLRYETRIYNQSEPRRSCRINESITGKRTAQMDAQSVGGYLGSFRLRTARRLIIISRVVTFLRLTCLE